MTPRPPLAVFLDPATHHLENDRLFDDDAHELAGDRLLAPFAHLRQRFAEQGVPVHTGDVLERGQVVAEHNVYLSLGMRTRWPRFAQREDVTLSAFFAHESPIVEPAMFRDLEQVSHAFGRVFSFTYAESLRPFLTAPVATLHYRLPQSFDVVHAEHWSRRDRGFLTLINANKRPRLTTGELYTERLRAVEFFGRTGEIDLYGVGWDVPPYHVGQTWEPLVVQRLKRSALARWARIRPDPLLVAARRAWRGSVPDKASTLAGYTFALCLENMILPGWITEKIFDCLYAGTVPLYLGDPEISDVVPPECFVDLRDFPDYAALSAYLHDLSPGEIEAMREAGRDFIGSVAFQPFSKAAFADLIGDIVTADHAMRA